MSGRVAFALVAALLVGACGSDDDPALSGVSTTTTVGAAPGDTEGTTAPATTPGGAPLPTTATGETVTTVAPATPASPDVSGPPGSAAAFYLRAAPATSIVLEVSAETGAEPSAGTVDHVRATLAEVSGKPVTVGGGGALPSREEWTADELRDAADAASSASQGERAVLRLLFVHGRYAEAENVLGVAVRADVAAIFSDAVEDSASPLIGPGAIEAAVTTHEVGHLLGLVDLHLKTGRADPDHPGHSANQGSVMYWAVESTLVTDLLTGGPPREFDDADRADLAAIRNGA
jgi:hypothetical protein